ELALVRRKASAEFSISCRQLCSCWPWSARDARGGGPLRVGRRRNLRARHREGKNPRSVRRTCPRRRLVRERDMIERRRPQVGPGVAPVRVEVLGNVDPAAGFFTVQVGAFRDRGNAERLRDRLNPSYSPIFIQQYDAPDGTFYRVRVGKITGEDTARQFGDQL